MPVAKRHRSSLTQNGRLKYALSSFGPSPVMIASTTVEFSTASCIAASPLSVISMSNQTVKPRPLRLVRSSRASIEARSLRCVYEIMKCHAPGAVLASRRFSIFGTGPA